MAYDVIIVGAGPAGCIAAYELAKQGITVLILEKTTFPRYKICGGGLTYKIIQEIPFDVSEVVESTIYSIRFSNNLKNEFSRSSELPLMFCTMREKLDHLLLSKALEAGAEVRFLQQVTAIENEVNDVVVSAKSAKFKAKLVIGADGPSSIVARSSGLRRNITQGLAWEAEVYTDPSILEKYSDTVFLDWGTFPGGYGWVFPKKDHFSIGVGGPASLSGQMMPYYDRFLEYLDFSRPSPLSPPQLAGEGEAGLRTRSLKSWPIPVRTKKGDFHSGRILVAGDAAGLTDSMTGEGIYYAIASGKMAAGSCSAFLRGETQSLKSFSDQVNDTLMSELMEGNKIKHIFNTVPLKIHCFVRDSDRAWRAFGKVLRGERSYRDVRLGFGKWKIFWNMASFCAQFVAKWKEKNFRKKIF